MKTKLKTILCLVVVILFATTGCDKTESSKKHANGEIVGYVNCYGSIGIFIITEDNDSLLSFNIPLSSINIDLNSLNSGVHGINGGNISFDYRIASGAEIKQMVDFLCPQNAMGIGFLGGPIENYTQIIINDIK